jgi:hypothetical protein
MGPGQNNRHIATSEVADSHKMEFPSPGPHTWGYSTVLQFVPPSLGTGRPKRIPKNPRLCSLSAVGP